MGKEKNGKEKSKSIDSSSNVANTPSSSSGLAINSVVNPPSTSLTPINWLGEATEDPKSVPLLQYMRQKGEEKMAKLEEEKLKARETKKLLILKRDDKKGSNGSDKTNSDRKSTSTRQEKER